MRNIYFFLVVTMLFGCQKELEFNRSIHVATAELTNLDVPSLPIEATALTRNRSPANSNYLRLLFVYQKLDNINTIRISMALPFPAAVSCEDIIYIHRNTWFSSETFSPFSSAFATEWDTIGEAWDIDDEQGTSFVCIESISDSGEELFGTFELHFKKEERRTIPGSIWPEKFSLTNGKFRAFVLDN